MIKPPGNFICSKCFFKQKHNIIACIYKYFNLSSFIDYRLIIIFTVIEGPVTRLSPSTLALRLPADKHIDAFLLLMQTYADRR